VSIWRPIFLAKTMIWAAPPLLVAVAMGLLSLRHRALRATTLAALVLLAGVGLHGYYERPDLESWDQAAAHVDAALRPGDTIVFSVDFLQHAFDRYHVAPPTLAVHEVGLTGTPEDLFLLPQIADTSSRVWLVASPVHPQPSTDAVVAALGASGQLLQIDQFDGVSVYLFDLGQR